MTWAGINFVDYIPLRGRRVPIKGMISDDSYQPEFDWDVYEDMF
jgi:hypothetical protein